jgi:hypothetical protein
MGSLELSQAGFGSDSPLDATNCLKGWTVMKESFWASIWVSFLRANGVLIGVLAVVVSVAFWLVAPDTSVPLGLALPIGLLCLVLIVTLGNAAYENFRRSRRLLPSVLHARKPPAETLGAKVLCLLEPSELFSHDALVSFYYVDEEGFEQLIGMGVVLNVQEDRKIQVALTQAIEGHVEKLEKLVQNEARILKKIRVKPDIQKTHFDLMTLGGGQ